MKILFVGNLGARWMSGWQRCQTLRELGHGVDTLAQDEFHASAFSNRWRRCLGSPRLRAEVAREFGRAFLGRLTQADPDLAWLEWPQLLTRATLIDARRQHPRCRFLSFQDDNPFGTRPGDFETWRLFLDAIPEYDLHFVKRPSDVDAYRQRGARHVELFMHGFFAPIFRPIPQSALAPAYRREATFVGTALDHRITAVADLLMRQQVPLTVFGNRWYRLMWTHPCVYLRYRSRFQPEACEDEYARIVTGSRISLAFVSSSNGDDYSLRTFEIPACRGFLLAERTPTHLALFQEGTEAEFFSSTDECADKIRFYLKEETARLRIAAAGYHRCVTNGYSLPDRMNDALHRAGKILDIRCSA